MILTQLTRSTRPTTGSYRGHTRVGSVPDCLGYAGPRDCHEAAGLFRLGLDEVLVPLDARECGNGAMRPRRQESRSPPQYCRRRRHRRNGMTEIVLAIPECTLAVLPGLTPVNGRQGHEENVGFSGIDGGPRLSIEGAPLLQCMAVGGVVINGRCHGQTGARTADDVCLGRMQIATGWIDPKGPP